MKKTLSLIALGLLVVVPSAFALTPAEIRQCQAMASTFSVKQAELTEQAALRDQLAETAELAGEEWENAEALRAFGAEQAEEADALRVTYDEAVAAFDGIEYALRDKTAKFNADLNAFNTKCVS